VPAVTGSKTVIGTPVNDAPVAHDDSATTSEDNATDINVVGNDSAGPADEASQALSVKADSISTPAHGTAELITSGTDAGQIRYTPNADYNGGDSFTYKVCDDGAGTPCSSDATVTLTVNPVNDAPTATNGSMTTDEDTAGSVDLSSLVGDTETANANLNYQIVSGPSHGSLSGSGTSRTYTPAADYNGSDSFTYKVNDGALQSTATTVPGLFAAGYVAISGRGIYPGLVVSDSQG